MTEQQFKTLFAQAKELMQQTKDPVHDWSHCERTIRNVFRIKELLPIAEQEKCDDKILILAAAWHDVSFVFHQPGLANFLLEGGRAAKISQKYFAQAKLSATEIKLICDIILHHPGNSFGILNRQRSLMHQVFQDADNLDSFAPSVRMLQVAHEAQHHLWYKLLFRFLKPIFFNFLFRHPKIIYNLPKIIKQIITTTAVEQINDKRLIPDD